MALASKWFTREVSGLRTFAYSEERDRPKIGLALGGGFGAAATSRRYRNPEELIITRQIRLPRHQHINEHNIKRR